MAGFGSGFYGRFWPLPGQFKARPLRQEEFAPPESGIKPAKMIIKNIDHTNNAITFFDGFGSVLFLRKSQDQRDRPGLSRFLVFDRKK